MIETNDTATEKGRSISIYKTAHHRYFVGVYNKVRQANPESKSRRSCAASAAKGGMINISCMALTAFD